MAFSLFVFDLHNMMLKVKKLFGELMSTGNGLAGEQIKSLRPNLFFCCLTGNFEMAVLI